MLQCFKNMFQATQAYEWMNDAHAHEMQVQMWKANTWGVTTLPPYKNLVPRFGRPTILRKIRDKPLVNNLLFPM